MEKLQHIIDSISRLDSSKETQIRKNLDNLTKPQGSLGRLEEVALQYCLIRDTVKPAMIKKKIFTFAADHGVAEEGVSAFPKEVTPQMVLNMLSGGAAVNVLARHVGAEVCVVDIGVDDPLEKADGICRRKVKRGTANISKGPAMTKDEAVQAIEIGIELAKDAESHGITLIGTGEMGIANTTAASALFASLLPCRVDEITGRGTGIDDTTLMKKIDIIHKALNVNREELKDPIGTLASIGGLEIAGICGLILGASSLNIPVVVDGFIASAGALVACRIKEQVKDYIFFSHRSDEAGHKTFFRIFGVEPILDLKMRLGEGTGSALAISIIEAAIKIYNEMATFSSAEVSEKSL